MSPLVVPLIAANGARSTLTLPDAAMAAQLIEFSDFAHSTSGLVLPGSLDGHGATYRMKAMTSTHAANVPTTVGTTTNPYTLVVVGGNASKPLANLDVGKLTLTGTPQGMLYNGLRAGYAPGINLHDITASGIPGNSNANPGETFTINVWHCDGARLSNVNLDGRDATGAPVAASLFGFNDTTGITLTGSSAHNAKYGMGATAYKCGDIHYADLDLSHNRRALNFERCFGFILLERIDMRGCGPLHVTVDTDGLSATVTIIDPIVDAWPLKVGVALPPALYEGNPQAQRVSDVRLIVAGKDVSADPHYLLCGNEW